MELTRVYPGGHGLFFVVGVSDDGYDFCLRRVNGQLLDDAIGFAQFATQATGRACSNLDYAGDPGGWSQKLGELLRRSAPMSPTSNAETPRVVFLDDGDRRSLLEQSTLGQAILSAEARESQPPPPPPPPTIGDRFRAEQAAEARERHERVAGFLAQTNLGRAILRADADDH